MSSFQRIREPLNAGLGWQDQQPHNAIESKFRGTRPCKTGQVRISSGNSDLDRILGDGIPLHSLTFLRLLQPQPLRSASDFSYILDIHRYFIAEGRSVKHTNILITPDEEEAASILKYSIPELCTSKAVNRDSHSNSLTIAWQYDKYLGTSEADNRKDAPFCHQYDLSKASNSIHDADIHIWKLDPSSVVGEIRKFMEQREENHTVRLSIVCNNFFLQNMANSSEMTLMYRFIYELKRLTNAFPIVCMFSLPSHLPVGLVSALSHISDNVLGLRSFAGEHHYLPMELKDSDGILVLMRVANRRRFAFPLREDERFSIVRTKKKLRIKKLHMPPENSRSGIASKAADCSGSLSKEHDLTDVAAMF